MFSRPAAISSPAMHIICIGEEERESSKQRHPLHQCKCCIRLLHHECDFFQLQMLRATPHDPVLSDHKPHALRPHEFHCPACLASEACKKIFVPLCQISAIIFPPRDHWSKICNKKTALQWQIMPMVCMGMGWWGLWPTCTGCICHATSLHLMRKFHVKSRTHILVALHWSKDLQPQNHPSMEDHPTSCACACAWNNDT